MRESCKGKANAEGSRPMRCQKGAGECFLSRAQSWARAGPRREQYMVEQSQGIAQALFRLIFRVRDEQVGAGAKS